MTKFVIDDGHNRHEAYSKDETDAAIVEGIGENLNAENIPIAAGSSKMTATAIEELQTDKQDKMLILSGEVTGSGGIMPAGVTTLTVTFGRTFKAKPLTQICFKSSASQFLSNEIQKCCIVDVTTTGMTIVTACAVNRYATVIWLAIGEEA